MNVIPMAAYPVHVVVLNFMKDYLRYLIDYGCELGISLPVFATFHTSDRDFVKPSHVGSEFGSEFAVSLADKLSQNSDKEK